MNTFHGTKNEEIQKYKPMTTAPLLGRRPLNNAKFDQYFQNERLSNLDDKLKMNAKEI